MINMSERLLKRETGLDMGGCKSGNADSLHVDTTIVLEKIRPWNGESPLNYDSEVSFVHHIYSTFM